MNSLDHIRTACSEDLARLNERIHECLRSSSELMTAVVEDNLRSKGKQIRPLVLMLCAKLLGHEVDNKILDAAAAVELLHNASLIHDDIVDDSPVRRGRPTVNATWDNHIAVLVGDFYTTAAMQRAIATQNIDIVETLCTLGRKLSLGEIEQLFFAREHTYSEENYFKVIDYKTSSLFVASAKMACQAVGASTAATDRLSEFAQLFGRCFQLRDDVFDFYDSAVVGKPTGNDLREGKVSLPLIYALNHCDTEQKANALGLLNQDRLNDNEITRLQALARENGGVEHAYAVMDSLRNRAAALLDGFGHSAAREMLLDLFDFVIARTY